MRRLSEILKCKRGSTEEVAPAPEPTQSVPVEQGKVDATPQTSADDLFSKVTRFVKENDPRDKPEAEADRQVFNDMELRDKINSIEDPDLKQHFTLLRKSLMSGVGDKFQEIAKLSKDIEGLKQTVTAEKGWSPERIKSLLNDPNFVQAAQAVAQGEIGVDDIDDDFVPDSVKRQLKELQDTVGVFKQQQSQASLMKEHDSLKQRYGNYDINKIEEVRNGLMNGRIQANSEHLYKAWYHDENVKNAYEMGRSDERSGIGEKAAASSFQGGQHMPSSDIKPEKGESDKAYWRRIVDNQMNKLHK